MMRNTSKEHEGMSTLFERLHILPVSSQVKEELVEKCQENDCLMRGGCDWQDDPYLEEYPYEFARIEDMEVLRQTLGGGNWAIRQGFLYKDLAFIQQVNAGDEWWTLKKTDDGWLDFESWSFGSVAKDFHKFARAITSMHIATPEECKDLDYMRDYEELMLPPVPLGKQADDARHATEEIDVGRRVARDTDKDR